MKLGAAFFPVDGAIRPDELARMLEARGFESLFLTDHLHIPATPATVRLMTETQGGVLPKFTHSHHVFVGLAYAAAVTTTLKIGTGVLLVPEHDAIATAKAVASLDVLSGGRFLFGVGAGWIPEETRNHGVVPRERWKVMGERVLAMREIWTHDEAEFHGAHVDFPPIFSWPKPAQRPWPPILVGGEGPTVLDRVVAYGDAWFPNDTQPLEVLEERMAELRQLAADAGRAPIGVSLYGADARLEHLHRLRELGAERACVYVPTQDAAAVAAFLDEVAPWVEELAHP